MTGPDSIARHARCKQLLFAALERPPEARRTFLEEACGEERELFEEVGSLLAQFTQLDGFLEDSIWGQAGQLEIQSALPAQLGPYRILRLLGRGGMGLVYLAEQPSPRRRVALKVLRLDAATDAARARFTREAEVLARCQHPGIAQVHEASVVETDLGPQPVICMEFVDGRPIVEHARVEGLDRRARIELILQVADAVAHAHAQGVLHRDLKPDNVLVDAAGRARVLDFGIAHVVGDEGDFVTRTGQVLGTVAYMSPEQARGGRVDERSDLFSLGAMLYELLTEHLPFETRGALVHEALRTLAEGDATPPSRHDTSLRGDLETVLAKALASEPVRRYRTVAELAADLRAYLAGRPVAARPPSAAYVLSKFARRHRALSLAVVVACLALGGGAAVALQALIRADQQVGYTELFADRNLLDQLRAEADVLWPADSTQVAALGAWLTRARDLEARLGAHRRRLVALEAEGPSLEPGAAVEPAWLLAAGRDLVRDLEGFVGPAGELALVSARLELAEQLHVRTITDQADAWAAAAERVAADPRFNEPAGFRLVPQEGLVVLGPDPDSGLEEFALLAPTGTVPTRDPSTGELTIGLDTTVVLVLIPGGECAIGDPRVPAGEAGLSSPAGVRWGWEMHEGPPFSVQLAPFLISKFELTQGQYLAAFGENPSDYGIGDTWGEIGIGPRNPVESVSWERLTELLWHLGLELPTEAQWEVAALGGGSSRWVFGESVLDTDGFMNAGGEAEVVPGWGSGPYLDGHYVHAPVGSYLANAYGLYDVLGNVWELCRDDYKVLYHRLEHRPGDGLVSAEPDGDVSRRGGSFAAAVPRNHAFFRGDRRCDSPNTQTGARPIWTLRE